MSYKRLPKSIRKYLRQEKSRLRRQISVDAEERIRDFLLGIRQRYNKPEVETKDKK